MSGDISVSFEFFPPKSERAETALWAALEDLRCFNPQFVSVTYGAGGSTRDKTHTIVTKIQNEIGVPAAAHLTCVGHTRAEIADIVNAYWEHNVRHIVALRGDPPGDIAGAYMPTPGGYAFADDLVAGLKSLHDFDISVAGYPETHPQAESARADLEHLKRKIEAGANRVITQFFFDASVFLRYRDQVAELAPHTPVIAGVLPITNFSKVVEFAGKCGAQIPDSVHQRFAKGKNDSQIGLDFAVEQCQTLVSEGVHAFHFYTLNKAELSKGVCQALGLKQQG